MTVFYRLRQDNQERSKHKGQWFAHAVNLGTIETDELARLIERNCSVKRSDVLAVLAELSDVIAQKLADSHRVRLAGIGSLMVGLNGQPCVRISTKYFFGFFSIIAELFLWIFSFLDKLFVWIISFLYLCIQL